MKIGLVFGGGFARGAAQAGFIKGMMNFIKEEDIFLVSCSSIGGLNGLAFTNHKFEYLESMYRNSNFQNMKNLKLNLKNRIIDEILEGLLKDMKITVPLYITGTCLTPISTHYFYVDNKTPFEEISKAINITLTFPFVNGVVRKEYGKLYLDGGGTDNIPAHPFSYNPADVLIILHCYPRYLPPRNIIEKNKVVIDIDITSHCDDSISTYSFTHKNLNEMFDVGFEMGYKFGERFFSEGYTIESIKSKAPAYIKEELEFRKNKKAPLTAAVFFNKLQGSRNLR